MKTLVLALVVSCLLFTGSICNAVVIMDATHHNGGLTANAVGYWYNTPDAVPAGWQQVTPYPYTTALMWTMVGSLGEACNNTGELVQAGYGYKISADLGGGDGIDATARVWATQNADGSGNKVLLASVHRIGTPNDGYTLFNTVGTIGAPAPASLAGYFIQVSIGGPYVDHYIAGYYDNLVVTGEMVPEPATMSILALGGLLLRRRK